MYDEWRSIYTALVCDIMDDMGYRDQALEHTIRPIHQETWFAGPAVTLDAYANSEPIADPYEHIFEAYNQVSPGDVFVIATNGELRAGLWGELLATAAATRGVHAVVTDGLVRDVRQMNAMNFSCFCRGYSPLDSAGRCYPTSVNEPVDCGGVRVHPGDFMLADFDGVAVIPASIQQEVFEKASAKLTGENIVRDALAAGRSPREVFDEYGIL